MTAPTLRPDDPSSEQLWTVVDDLAVEPPRRRRALAIGPTGVRRANPSWVAAYKLRLVVTDTLLIAFAVGGSQLLWFGLDNEQVQVSDGSIPWLSYSVTSVLLVAGWLAALHFYGSRDQRLLGAGLDEYARVADASFRLFGLVAIVALLVHADLARGYIITAFPLGVALLTLSRWLWRQWLRRERRRTGRFLIRVLLVGSAHSVEHLVGEIDRRPYLGFDLVGACYTGPAPEHGRAAELEVLGDLDDVSVVAKERDLHAVALAGSEGLPAGQVRRLAWELESTGVDIMVAPAITDVAGPRIHSRPVGGLPLIYVESPSYEAGAKIAKNVFDFAASFVLLVLASPVLLAAALAIKATSPGPVLFRQERIGLNGKVFSILKFRSMRVGADDELARLLADQGTDDRPLFKVDNDPRITRVGRFMRKYSIDELPQLLNVLKGDMSLVGPRPQRAEEVALYDPAASRRLLVKPGITGLWQISGRSDLSWEDAIRWDLYYVENWSLIDDLLTLIRTVGVVLRSRGAR
ncbi:sugar transferase [Naasia sp. SYSU D00948]|uniref:sugar transferase n=1 Tax=Naasia sp. SYSU D00948 TaxID=2817379 RepID=UPI001B3021A9|nr:sugar transferase [Naasia sp. SYSU D00948]